MTPDDDTMGIEELAPGNEPVAVVEGILVHRSTEEYVDEANFPDELLPLQHR